MSIYLDNHEVDIYDAPVNIDIGRRGIGKTFGRKKKAIRRAIISGIQFVFIVFTDTEVKKLCANDGDKFFKKIILELKNNPTSRNNFLLSKMEELVVDEDNNAILNKLKIRGGAIKNAKQTLGYIVSINDYASLKGNEFEAKTIIFDEFIPEEETYLTRDIEYKLVSVVQTIARTRTDIKLYMSANPKALNSPLLLTLKCGDIKKGEIRPIKDRYGYLFVVRYIDESKYEKFKEEADRSVAGRLATFLGETTQDDGEQLNDYSSKIFKAKEYKHQRYILTIKGSCGTFRIHKTEDETKWLVYSNYGTTKQGLFVTNKRYLAQDYQVAYNTIKEALLNALQRDIYLYENQAVAELFVEQLKKD